MRRGGNAAGFTLVELMVVVTILGIIAIIAVPQLSLARQKGVRRHAKSTITKIATAMEQRYSANGNFSYTNGNGACSNTSATFTPGSTIPDLNIAIQDPYFSYTITVTKTGNFCNDYLVEANGVADPVTSEHYYLQKNGQHSWPAGE